MCQLHVQTSWPFHILTELVERESYIDTFWQKFWNTNIKSFEMYKYLGQKKKHIFHKGAKSRPPWLLCSVQSQKQWAMGRRSLMCEVHVVHVPGALLEVSPCSQCHLSRTRQASQLSSWQTCSEDHQYLWKELSLNSSYKRCKNSFWRQIYIHI